VRQAVEMVGEQPQRVGMEPVVGPVAVAVGRHQAGRSQDLEMVADQRLGGIEFLGEVSDAQLLAGQQLHDPPAQRITQRPRDLQRRGSGMSGGQRSRSHLDQD
jgi:hypothetical protein